MARLLPLVLSPRDAGLRESRFRACYAADYRAVRRYIARLSGRPDEADDLTQDAFVRLWQRLQEQDVEDLRPFVYRIASNLVINRHRDRRRAAAIEAPMPENVVQMRAGSGDVL